MLSVFFTKQLLKRKCLISTILHHSFIRTEYIFVQHLFFTLYCKMIFFLFFFNKKKVQNYIDFFFLIIISRWWLILHISCSWWCSNYQQVKMQSTEFYWVLHFTASTEKHWFEEITTNKLRSSNSQTDFNSPARIYFCWAPEIPLEAIL